MSARLGAVRYGREQGDPFLGRSMGNQPDYSLEVAHEIDEEVRALIEAAHTEAWEILNTYRDILDALVFELLEKETLTRRDLERIFDRVEKRPRITAFNDFGGRTPSDKPPIQSPAERARERGEPWPPPEPAREPTPVGSYPGGTNGVPQPGPPNGVPTPTPGPPGSGFPGQPPYLPPGYHHNPTGQYPSGYVPVGAPPPRPGPQGQQPNSVPHNYGAPPDWRPATTPSGQSWPPEGHPHWAPPPPPWQVPVPPAAPAPGRPERNGHGERSGGHHERDDATEDGPR
jgi:cell division protease FtsH